jgi:hypothetical protein
MVTSAFPAQAEKASENVRSKLDKGGTKEPGVAQKNESETGHWAPQAAINMFPPPHILFSHGDCKKLLFPCCDHVSFLLGISF